MVILQRPCLRCGALIAAGSYCGRCQPDYSPRRLRGRRWMRKRAAVFRRASYLCEVCGRLAEEVHHRDGDVTNNALDNLMAVCRGCHRRLEAEKRI